MLGRHRYLLVQSPLVGMNDWKRPSGGGGGGAKRSYVGPNGSTEKVDYSRLPLAGGSDDEGDDWIQKQIRGQKVSLYALRVPLCEFMLASGCLWRVVPRTGRFCGGIKLGQYNTNILLSTLCSFEQRVLGTKGGLEAEHSTFML